MYEQYLVDLKNGRIRSNNPNNGSTSFKKKEV